MTRPGAVPHVVRRPTGLILVMLVFVGYAVLYAVPAFKYFQAAGQGIKGSGMEMGTSVSMAFVMLTFAVVDIWTAVGIWRRQNWARATAIWLALMSFIGIVLVGGPIYKLACLGGSALTIIYLMAPDSKRWFRNMENYPDRLDRAA